jgi:hypothetical protein
MLAFAVCLDLIVKYAVFPLVLFLVLWSTCF